MLLTLNFLESRRIPGESARVTPSEIRVGDVGEVGKEPRIDDHSSTTMRRPRRRAP